MLTANERGNTVLGDSNVLLEDKEGQYLGVTLKSSGGTFMVR